MRKALVVLLFIQNRFIPLAFSQSPGDYRSKQTGLWSAAATWETYDGTNWLSAATAPSSSNGIITIFSGHTITSNATVTADQIKINTGGSLVISGGTFTLNDGTGTDLDCDGTFELGGGTFNGAGITAFNLNSVFNWTGGTNSGSGIMNINLGSTCNMSNNGRYLGETKVLNNYGTISWTAGAFYFSAGQPVLNNYGSFNIYTDADVGTSGGPTPVFNNKSTGVINKIGSPGEETYFPAGTAFKNEGTININSSSLQFNCDINSLATINVGFGANLDFRADTAQINAGSVITGEGNFICSGAVVLLNAGSVSIRNFTVSNGTATNAIPLTFNADQSLNIINGNFNSAATIALNTGSAFNWSDGKIGGNGVMNINSGCVAEMTAGTRYLADNKVVNNYGTWSWTGGSFYFYTGSPVVNNYGIFNINTDADAGTSGIVTATFNNKSTGIINKTGAFTEETSFNGGSVFTNEGTINVNSGKLHFLINATNTANINLNFGATLNFAGNTTTINAGTIITGDGNLEFASVAATISSGNITVKHFNILSGTVTLNTALTLGAEQVVDLASGMFNGTGNINFNTGSTFNWENGFNGGSGIMNINAGALVNISNGSHYLTDSKTLNNYGTCQWNAGTLTYYNGSAIINNFGNWDIETDADMDLSGGTGSFNNKPAGMITKNGSASDPTAISGITVFNNDGTIDINSGKMKFSVGVTNTGSINVDYGSDINFSSGNTAINSGSALSGDGNLNFDGATAILNDGTVSVRSIYITAGTVTLTPSIIMAADKSLTLSGGTFNGTGNIIFSSGSSFVWEEGTNAGSGIITINAGADFIMNTGNHYLAETRTINNYGHWVWTAGPFIFYNGSPVANNYGSFDINTDADISSSSATGVLNNKSTGIINKNGSSTGETLIYGISSFNNEGAVNMLSGGLQLNVAGTHSGTYDLSFGSVLKGTLSMSFTGSTFNNNGSVSLTAIAFDAASVQYLKGIGSINTLTINNTVGVMQTEEQTIVTQINIHPNSRLTVYHDLNVN